jgi:hypothetical protein
MLSEAITSVAHRHCLYQGGGAGRLKKLIIVLFSTWFSFNGGYGRPLLYLANEELQAPWTSVQTDVDTVIRETGREEYPSCKLMETPQRQKYEEIRFAKTNISSFSKQLNSAGYLQGIS